MRRTRMTLAGVALLILGGCQPKSASLEIAAPQFAVDRMIAEDLVALSSASSTIDLKLTAKSMPEGNALDALQQGFVDLALVSNVAEYRPGIESVMPLYPTVLHVAYRDGRDASDGLALLDGARVFAGSGNSASRQFFDRVVGRLGIAGAGFRYVTAESDADVIVRFAPLSPELVAGREGFRLFSFGSAEDIGKGTLVEAATMMNPQLRAFVIPAGTYGAATPEPILTLAVDNYLVARTGVPESVIYDLVRELLRSRPALAAKNPGLFTHLSDDFDVSGSTFIVHPGTRAYLERDEPTVYERYAGVAELVVTLAITFFSVSVAGVRILHRRRKNRIDQYYASALDIRESVMPGSSAVHRRNAIERISDLQKDAFEQLVADRLNADESFRIFISLAQEVKRELGERESTAE